MVEMLEIIKELTLKKVEQLKSSDSSNNNNDLNLPFMINDLVIECVQASIFGSNNADLKLKYFSENIEEELNLGKYVKKLLFDSTKRMMNPLRFMIPFTLEYFVTSNDKRVLKNMRYFR
jgi:hypothetical protein